MRFLELASLFGLFYVATALPSPDSSSKLDVTVKRGSDAVPPPPPPCTLHTVQQVNHVAETAELVHSEATVGSVTCAGNEPGGCSLNHGNTYSISIGYSVGGGFTLNLEKIFTLANLDASFTYSTTKGTVNSGTVNCPHGKWTCGLQITPYGKEVNGAIYKSWYGGVCEGGQPVGKKLDKQHFTVYYPKVTDNQPDVDIRVCTCPNLYHESGAPPLCPKNC